MLIQATIKVIEKTIKTYTFEGKTGVSRKVRALVEDTDIFEFKFNDDEIAMYESLPSSGEVDVEINVTSPKEKIQAKIVKLL